MNLTDILNSSLKTVKLHSPEILTALGISGVATTAYLAIKAGRESANPKYDVEYVGAEPDKKQQVIDKAKLTWKLYIPPVASGIATMAFIAAASRGHSKRTTAAVTAYSLTERAFIEYKDKVIEQYGKGKEQKIRDAVAQDRVLANPVGGREVMVIGGGQVLCYDLRSARYFRSNMEALKKAENEINFQLNHERMVSLSEFYVLLGQTITEESVHNGWLLDRDLMSLDISTTLADNDEPCLVIGFNYVSPLHDETFPACTGPFDR